MQILNRYWLKISLLSALLLFVVASVYVSDTINFVSNARAVGETAVGSMDARSQFQSCEVIPAMRKDIGDKQGLNPENISFLNWNIYKGIGENWQQDMTVFAQTHDVMTIQEAMLDGELTGLLDTHNFNWVMNTSFYLNGIAAGVMTVAISEAVHSCGFKVSEPLIRIPKSVLISYYAVKGTEKKLLVANIHGINFTIGVNSYRRQLGMLHDAIEHHDGPMIVAGDFNSWSKVRMAEVRELINKLSLLEIEYPINTKTHVFGNAIDHVFYRQLELVNNHVWQVTSSDHNPISVNFKLL